MRKEVDFRIASAPVAIELECPYCLYDIRIPWDDIDQPEYWGDSWDDVICPICGKKIQLGDWEYN